MVKNTSIAAGFAVTELTASLPRLANANAGDLLLVLARAWSSATCSSPCRLAYAVHRLERRVAILR